MKTSPMGKNSANAGIQAMIFHPDAFVAFFSAIIC